jgi:hypothetical protein
MWTDRKRTITTARRLLANRVYKGEVVSGAMVGLIDPIVDEILWDFAQHPLNEDAKRKPKAVYPLSGIATCAGCREGLVGHTSNGQAYRCTTQGCPMHVKAEPLEELVLGAIRERPPAGLSAADVLRYSVAILAARKELESYVTTVPVGNSPETWVKGRDEREAALARAQIAWDEAREKHGEVPDLADPSLADQRRIFERAVGSLTVARGRGPLPDRVKLKLTS